MTTGALKDGMGSVTPDAACSALKYSPQAGLHSRLSVTTGAVADGM